MNTNIQMQIIAREQRNETERKQSKPKREATGVLLLLQIKFSSASDS